MRRYFRYILLSLVLGICAGSCIEEMEVAQPELDKETLTTLVPRVTSFTNKYVTKADGENLEARISSLVVLVFNKDGAIVHIQQQTDANTSSVVLNKSMLDSPQQAGKLSTATVAMIANVAIDNIKDGNDKSIRNIENLSELDSYICSFTEAETVITAPLGSEFKGFPMFGQKTVNLTATKGSHAEEIPLKILYAKVNFEIAVKDGTENSKIIDGNTQFRLDNYSVYNTSTATKLGDITASDTATESDAYGYTSGKVVEMKTGNTATLNSSTVSFTLYVAENRYNHTGLSGIYPNGWLSANDDEDVKGYKDMDDAEKAKPENKLNGVKYFYDDYIQQYKPKLAESSHAATPGDLATYIKLTGEYTDYRGTLWNVNYNIYLGKDNAQNFHVDRNSEYTNKITIKGIRNNDSYTDTDEEGKLVDEHVWIDHRVNVSLGANQGADDCVTITRETLIDSHIEVRPLRVNLKSDYVAAAIYLPKYPLDSQGKIIYNTDITPSSWGQVEEIAGNENENWIAIENNDGKYNKGKLYCSNGKRKYFTTSLIEELHLDNNAEENGIRTDESGNKYIPLKDGECAWVYFDENGTANTRRAQIDVVFYTSSGGTTETFDIYQSGLEEFGGLQFETYEEYLHSYDSEDQYQYGLDTSPSDYTQQGLAWGIMVNEDDGYQLSENYIVKSNSGAEDLTEKTDRYDYGHINDFPNHVTRIKRGESWVNADITQNTGLEFTYRAFLKVPDMTVMDMGTRPTSAYQYCLSKNKFHEDPDGEDHQMIMRWYLPDVYEMQTILQSQTSPDFDSGAYYWSSQPSYSISQIRSIVSENDKYARAVTSNSNTEDDFKRTEQHRIRCAYNNTGRDADMTDRVPDGLGGIIRIPMKAYETYPDVRGYFGNWLSELDENPKNTPQRPDYSFPKGTDAHTFKHIAIDNKIYYIDDPLTNWSYNPISASGNTLYHYPGLSKKDVVKDTYTNEYTESANDKKYTRTESKIKGQKIESLPSNEDLMPLDYLDQTDLLTISFNRGSNTSNMPSYSYRREDSNQEKSYTQYWGLPQYRTTSVKASSGSELTIEVSYEIYYHMTNWELTYDIGDQYVHENETYEITNRRTTGNIFNKKYYFDLGPTYIDQECFEYIDGTGGWSTPSENTSYPQKTVIDKLEIFGGNTFTITAKDGYIIQSIKVNYSGSNSVHTSTITGEDGGASDNRFLRLVETRPTESNDPPQNMSYSGDGDIGWFKWASTGDQNVSSVTLELVTYTVNESFSIGGISLWPASFNYIVPDDVRGYKSDFDTSIVIDSFEIRITELDNNN